MDREIIKTENGHEVKIALIQKDMEYVRGSLGDIAKNITLFDTKFVRRDELSSIITTIENVHKDMRRDILKNEEDIKMKVNTTDFTPIKNILGRLNWLMISAVFIALLSLLIHR